jgi:L-fuculose-phosphate aldolase
MTEATGLTGAPGPRDAAAAGGTPGFATEDEARRAIVEACLRMNALGINQGKAGNVSLRWDRGGSPGLLVTPSALAYERAGADDVVWLSLETRTPPGGEPEPARVDGVRRPSTEWRMHRDVYAARPDANAVVHAHSPHAAALSCVGRVQDEGIPAFHYMVAVAGGPDLRCAAYATFGTQALSDRALAALRERRACLLAHHGQLALGASLDEALALAVEVESLARTYSLALQAGGPRLLDAAEMDRVARRFAGYG